MNELTKIVIVGAGGLGREIVSLLRSSNAIRPRWAIQGFLDSDLKLAGTQVVGIPILGDDEWCQKNNDDTVRFVCAIGNPKARRRSVEKLGAMNCTFTSIVHPDVRIPDSVEIGVGSVIMAGSQFTANAMIGSHVVIYVNCSITHDVRIGDFCLIPSGCNFAGSAILETGVELGTGVSVIPHRRIGAWAIIGAGSVVTQDIPPHTTAVGVPCRVIESRVG